MQNILDKPINEIYRIAILHHLGTHRGNKTHAANSLGVTVRGLRKTMHRFKITASEIKQAIEQAKLERRTKLKLENQIQPISITKVSPRQKAIDCLIKSKGNLEIAAKLFNTTRIEFILFLSENKIPF
jgi:hypothetical protein